MSKESNPEPLKQALATRDQAKPLATKPSSPLPTRPAPFNPFLNSGLFSFRYSYHEMSSSGDKTHIKSREVRYEDGKLSSEQFEATADAKVYAQAVQDAENLVNDSMGLLFKSVASLFPFDAIKKNRE